MAQRAILAFFSWCRSFFSTSLAFIWAPSRSFDECCGKIDLFSVKNRVVHILWWWESCQVYQREGLFHERCLNLRLFWYQIHGHTSNKTNFTQFWSPKNCQFFLPQTGQFSCDTRHLWSFPSIFRVFLLMKRHEAAYAGKHLNLNQLRKQVIKIPVALVDYWLITNLGS